MSLYPTPTRLRRLREVARGEIYHYGDGNDYDAQDYRCTAVIRAMERVGWVVLPTTNAPPHKRAWLITEAGMAILREAK